MILEALRCLSALPGNESRVNLNKQNVHNNKEKNGRFWQMLTESV